MTVSFVGATFVVLELGSSGIPWAGLYLGCERLKPYGGEYGGGSTTPCMGSFLGGEGVGVSSSNLVDFLVLYGDGNTSTGVLGNVLMLYGRTVYLLRSFGVDSIPRTALILRLRAAGLGVFVSVSDHVSSSWMSLLAASMEMPVSESAPDNDSYSLSVWYCVAIMRS